MAVFVPCTVQMLLCTDLISELRAVVLSLGVTLLIQSAIRLTSFSGCGENAKGAAQTFEPGVSQSFTNLHKLLTPAVPEHRFETCFA